MVDASAPGTVLVRVRWTPYWSIERGTGCVEQAPGGYTMIDVTDPGPIPRRDRLRAMASGQLGPALPSEPVIQYGTAQSSAAGPRMATGRRAVSAARLRRLSFLPRGPLDLLLQLPLLAAAYWPWRHARGAVDAEPRALLLARPRPDQRRALARSPGRAERPALGGWRGLAGRGGALGLREPPLQGQLPDARDPLLPLPGQLRLRPQRRLRRDGDLGDRLRPLPDRAAALHSRAGSRPLQLRHRQQPAALESRRPALQPVRRRALDARRALRDPGVVAGDAGPPRRCADCSSPIRS